MKKFQDLKFVTKEVRKDLQVKRAEELFDNGYGISVIEYTYEDGVKYEVGILEHQSFKSISVKLSNNFGGPLIPRLLPDGVTRKLIEVQEYLNHGTSNRENEERTKRQNQYSGDETPTYHF